MFRIKIILFFFCFSSIFSQSKKFIIQDSISKLVIEHVAIDLRNNKGFFSNEKGEFYINTKEINSITVSHLSYEEKIVNFNSVDSVILMIPKINLIEEVVISIKKKKKKEIQQEFALKKNNIFAGFGAYGFQFTTIIKPFDTLRNYYYDKIKIPISLNEFDAHKYKQIPLGLVRVSFHEIENDLPTESIIDKQYYCIIDKRVLKRKFIELELFNRILIPTKGIVCVVTMLGKTDEKGSLILEDFNYYMKINNEKIKFLKTLPFTIPLVKIEQEDKKNSPSKAKIYFNKSSEYLGITPPFSVPAGLSEKERMDYIKNRNIGNDKKFFVPLGINYIYYE
jgi:hypothetical protein